MSVLLLPLLSASALAAPEMIPAEAMEVVGHPAADLVVALRDGGTFSLAEQRGRPVVVSFWASWCGPCRAELPALTAFAKERPDVTFLALNVDRDRADAEKFLAAVAVGVPVAFDPEATTMGAYGVMSMPTSFLIDAKGVVRWQRVGFNREKGMSELQAALKELK